MSRAGPRALAQLETVLAALRGYESLSERRPGVFDLGRRHFLHFHDTPDGLFADVFLASGRVRLPASRPSEQLELLGVVDESLSTAERRTSDNKRRRNGWRITDS